jgi:hypothetical protein
LKRILYISTARSKLAQSELEELLAKARAANSAKDLTGLLVVGGRRFLQVLEGPDDVVTATYEKIERDPRHFALVKLHDKEVETRSFPSWAMGFESGGLVPKTATLEQQVNAIVAPIADPTLRAYFTGFAKSHSSA